MTIDDSAGDTGSLGHNTDGFDIGTSSNVMIDGAKVYNQDDCVAVNSGTVSHTLAALCSTLIFLSGYHFPKWSLLRRPRSVYRLRRWTLIQCRGYRNILQQRHPELGQRNPCQGLCWRHWHHQQGHLQQDHPQKHLQVSAAVAFRFTCMFLT